MCSYLMERREDPSTHADGWYYPHSCRSGKQACHSVSLFSFKGLDSQHDWDPWRSILVGNELKRDDIQCLFSLGELSFLFRQCNPFEFVPILGILLGDILLFLLIKLSFGEFYIYLFWYPSGLHVEILG